MIAGISFFFLGLLVILALLFLTPYFSFIPRATLAAIIIAAVIFMVEVKVVRPMWRTKSKNILFKYSIMHQDSRYWQNQSFICLFFFFRIRSNSGTGHIYRVSGSAFRDWYSVRNWYKYPLHSVSRCKTENIRRKTQCNYSFI